MTIETVPVIIVNGYPFGPRKDTMRDNHDVFDYCATTAGTIKYAFNGSGAQYDETALVFMKIQGIYRIFTNTNTNTNTNTTEVKEAIFAHVSCYKHHKLQTDRGNISYLNDLELIARTAIPIKDIVCPCMIAADTQWELKGWRLVLPVPRNPFKTIKIENGELILQRY